MKPILILNDVHLGVTRVSGTTPATASALKTYLQSMFRDTIMRHKDKDLLILGDLLDGFTIEGRELLEVYQSLAMWLMASGNTLHLVPGNHDVSAKGDKLSSFHFMAEILVAQFGDRVKAYGHEFSEVAEALYTVPHCMNQDLFELELEKALAAPPGTLLLHCNVMNPFADKADHSLNLQEEWCQRLTARHHLIVAHEHQRRSISMGKGISVLGNQWPSSVADCLSLAGQRGEKFAHVWADGVVRDVIATWVQLDDVDGFAEVDWTDLAEAPARGFIRVTGHATAEAAADVITAIAKFRSKSPAFVVTNAVAVEGINNMGALTETSLEAIQSFNVLGALLELLEPEERKTIEEILK